MNLTKHWYPLPVKLHGESGGRIAHVAVVTGGILRAGVVAVLHVPIDNHAPLLPVPEVVVLQDVVELDREVAPLQRRVQIQIHRVYIGKCNQLQTGYISLKLEELSSEK